MKRSLILTTALALATSTFAATGDELLSMSWDEIVAQAKEEGEISWYVWYLQPEFREFIQPFEEEYGIKVSIPDGTSGEGNMQKLLAEQGRETGDIDVYAMGGDNTEAMNVSEVFLGPILPVMPESDALTDKINGGDGKGYTVAYWGNQSAMAYDSNRVNVEDLPKTVDDLTAWLEANPKALGFNYENGGSGPSFAQNITRTIVGVDPNGPEDVSPDLQPAWDWFNAHKDQYVFTGSNVDSINRLNDGEFLLVPAWEDHLAGLIKSNTVGDHLKMYMPEWGMDGGGNMVAIAANAPHPAASLVFVEWLTSAETQTELNARFGTAPTNSNADGSAALISADERQYTRLWNGPLKMNDFLPGFIENVAQQ